MGQKGICLFEDLGQNLEKHSASFDKNDKKSIKQEDDDEVKCTHGEKFNINEDHDFKEWERYDILQHKNDKKSTKGTIKAELFPDYIQNDLNVGPHQ